MTKNSSFKGTFGSYIRESSIFFSIFIGYFFLKEKITSIKIIAIILIVLGVFGLKFL